jgi:hypothetical protein
MARAAAGQNGSRGRAAQMRRTGARPRMGRTSTCGKACAMARPGMTATPRPAAANAWTATLSSVVKATRGSNPAAACVPVFVLTLAWERRLARRGGEPLLDLPLFGDRAFAAGAALNFALVFFFGSFMFVLTLLLQDGLGQPPLQAGLEAGPLALAFTTMSVLGPRLAVRLGPWSITLGAGLDLSARSPWSSPASATAGT